MSYRTDKFEVGDRVTWSTTFVYDTDSQYLYEMYGLGPFIVKEVYDRDEMDWEAICHTQHIDIDDEGMFSGAFFKKVS